MRIPKYESTERMTPEAGAPRISPDLFTGPARSTQVVGAAMQDIHKSFSDAKNLKDYTDANTRMARGFSEIEAEAMQGDPFQSPAIAQERMNKLRKEVISPITDPQTQLRISGSFDTNAIGYMQKINAVSRRGQIDSMKISMIDNIEAMQKKYVASDSAQRAIILKDIKSTINEHIGRKVIDAEAGRKYYDDIEKQLPILDAKAMINANPYIAEEMLVNNEFGIDDPAERNTLINLAKNMQDANNYEFTRAKVSTRFDTIAMIANGDINAANVDEYINKVASIDIDLAESMRKAFYSKGGSYLPEDKNNDEFNTIVDQIFTSKSADEVSKILIRTLKENKNISKDRLAILVDAGRERAKFAPLRSGENVQTKPNFMDSAYKLIKTAMPVLQLKDYIFERFMKRVKAEGAQGERIMLIANEEVENQKKMDNPNRTKYNVGDIVPNPLTGKSYKITGYDSDGEPLVDEIK